MNAIEECKWQEKEWVLTTPEDEEQKKMKAMEDAALYNDKFGDHMVDTSRKEKLKYVSKEALNELNCDHWYKSVHQKKGNYVGLLNAPTFQVSGKSMEGYSSVEEATEKTRLETMSHAELVKLLKKHKTTAYSKGSAPSDDERPGSGRSDEEDSSSESLSGSSSSSGSSFKRKRRWMTPLLLVMEETLLLANQARMNSPLSRSLCCCERGPAASNT